MKHLPALKMPAGLLILCILQTTVMAQNHQELLIDVRAFYGSSELVLDSNYLGQEGAGLKLEACRFYISNLRLMQDDSVAWKEKDSYHLYDRASEKIITMTVPSTGRFNTLQFDLGIDSLTNVSGAMGGDLDPTKGMYWTWQSGYINFKLEGKSAQCSDPKKEFQFHLGGYRHPYKTLQTISLKVTSKHHMLIIFDVEQFLKAVDLQKQDHMMSPTNEAVRLSSVAAACFRIQS